METSITVREVLDTARRYHRRLADIYDKWAENASERRVMLLLQHMSRREREFDQKLEAHGRQHVDHLLDTRLRFVPNVALLEGPDVDEMLSSEVSMLKVCVMANHFNQILIEYYNTAAGHADPGNVRELFLSIVEVLRYRKTVHTLEFTEGLRRLHELDV